MLLQKLPSIPEIEFIVVQLIALTLLILAGIKLVLHECESLKRKKPRGRQNQPKKTSEGSSP